MFSLSVNNEAVMRGPVSLDFLSGTCACDRARLSVPLLKEMTAETVLTPLHSQPNIAKRNWDTLSSTGTLMKSYFSDLTAFFFVTTLISYTCDV